MKRSRGDAGFALAALIFFATAASILLAAAYPSYVLQAKREREQELIFRGEEYMRAIQKYQRRFSVYPPSIDALLQSNGTRFLRRQYLDPINGEELRAITINPDGTLNGSVVPPPAPSVTPNSSGSTRNPGLTPTPQRGLPPASGLGTVQGSSGAGNGIVGVASNSKEPSLKVYNGHDHYNEWEFIAVPSAPPRTTGSTAKPPSPSPPNPKKN